MSCDYHGRTDFRAFDVMVDAIDNATRSEIESAIATTSEMAHAPTTRTSHRVLWLDFGRLLRRQLRRF